MAHLQDHLGALGWRLPAEAAARLDAVSRPTMRYPVAMEYDMALRRAQAVGGPRIAY